MKFKKIIQKVSLGAGSILLTASNAFAAEFKSTSGFLTDAANNLDSMLQPFGDVIAANVPLIFKLVMGAAILLFAVLATIYKNRGRSGQAAEHRANAWDAFTTAVIAVFLYSIFSGICTAFGV